MTFQPRGNQVQETADSTLAAESTTGWIILRHEILYFLWALMELAILTPLVLAFAPWSRLWPPGLTVVLLLLLMLIPFNLSRLMSTLDFNIDVQRTVLAVGLIVTIIIAWRLLLYSPRPVIDVGWIGDFFNHVEIPGNPFRTRDVTIFLLVTIMWWRGISLIGRHADIGEIGFRMRFEILLLFILVAGMAGSLLPWSVTPFILLFFFASLLAIVITRVEQLELGRTGQTFPMTLRWLLVVSGAAALIAFATGTLAGALSGDSVTNTLGLFTPLWEALNRIGIAVVAIISYLISPLLIFLNWLLGLIISAFGPTFQGAFDDLELLPQSSDIEQLPDEMIEATETAIQYPRQLLSILVMLFVALFVTLALGRMIRVLRKPAQSETQTSSPLSNYGRFQRPNLGQRLLDRLGVYRRWRAAASIRHLYREMCYTAADHGFPRGEAETPYEYLLTLTQAWPDSEADIVLITEAYVRVHYGELPESKEELNTIEAAWKRLESRQPAELRPDDEDLSIQRR